MSRSEQSTSRRHVLRGAAALPLGAAAATTALGYAEQNESDDSQPPGFPGVITRQTQPFNAEFPFPTLHGFLTPNEQFYIRTHFNVPELDAQDYRIQVEGHVEKPFEIRYDELRELPSMTMPVLLECSGNGRIFLEPPQVSIRWEQGGVSNAEWTGVPLSKLLERARVKPGAVAVILEGHDKGKFDSPQPKTPGEIQYARSLPIDKATQPEVLLAYQMNGQDLPPDHGFPVRAIVAGWYGMASVKWLRRIIVTDRPFHGYFETFAYAIWDRCKDEPTLVPVTEIEVKSQIARPMCNETIQPGSKYRIFGAAWAGRRKIDKVEISSDAGESWTPAKLEDRSVPYAWRFFEHVWDVPTSPGKYTLMARATDEDGNSQPFERDDDRLDAVVTHVLPIEVYVRA